MVHESRLIQFFIHGSRLNKKITSRGPKKILLFLITIQEKENQFNSRFTRKKNRPVVFHIKSIRDPLVNQ